MSGINTKVKAFRLPISLADQLEAATIGNDAPLLVKILLEDFFAGKNFYSKLRFESLRKLKRKRSSNFGFSRSFKRLKS